MIIHETSIVHPSSKLDDSVEIGPFCIVGENVERLCHISNIQFKEVNSETLMVALDLNGIGVSRGSACASGAQKPSHVLKAMKVDEKVINNHLRFSFGWTTQNGDGIKFAEIVKKTIKELI